jgi:hypothetical protein
LGEQTQQQAHNSKMALAKAPVVENSCISFIIVTNKKHIDKLIVMLKLLESW